MAAAGEAAAHDCLLLCHTVTKVVVADMHIHRADSVREVQWPLTRGIFITYSSVE